MVSWVMKSDIRQTVDWRKEARISNTLRKKEYLGQNDRSMEMASSALTDVHHIQRLALEF